MEKTPTSNDDRGAEAVFKGARAQLRIWFLRAAPAGLAADARGKPRACGAERGLTERATNAENRRYCPVRGARCKFKRGVLAETEHRIKPTIVNAARARARIARHALDPRLWRARGQRASRGATGLVQQEKIFQPKRGPRG